MKHIVKQSEPEDFARWKAQANDDWQPTYDNMPGDIKNGVKAALMAEQGFLCCYCESRLHGEQSHIEHFRPQSDPVVDPLDYANMLCSCGNRFQKGEPRHCGSLKDDWFDPDLLVSPFAPGCEERFAFLGDGRIEPRLDGDRAAKESIKRLGLGLPKLNDMRAKVIEPFLDESLSMRELRDFVAAYLQPDETGRFGEYWTTIRFLFGGNAAP